MRVRRSREDVDDEVRAAQAVSGEDVGIRTPREVLTLDPGTLDRVRSAEPEEGGGVPLEERSPDLSRRVAEGLIRHGTTGSREGRLGVGVTVGDGLETLGEGADGSGSGASADPQAITPTSSKDARTDHLICSHLRRESPPGPTRGFSSRSATTPCAPSGAFVRFSAQPFSSELRPNRQPGEVGQDGAHPGQQPPSIVIGLLTQPPAPGSPSSPSHQTPRERSNPRGTGYKLRGAISWDVTEYPGTWTELEQFSPGAEVPGEDVVAPADLSSFLVSTRRSPPGQAADEWLESFDALVADGLTAECPGTTASDVLAGEPATVVEQPCEGSLSSGGPHARRTRVLLHDLYPADDAAARETLERLVTRSGSSPTHR